MNSVDTSSIGGLRREWVRVAIASYALLAFAAALLRLTAFEPHISSWLLIGIIVNSGILAYLWRLLPSNHAQGSARLYPSLGAGTWLTVLGGVLTAMLAGFLLSPWPGGWLAWLPALLYLVSRLVDLVDGYVARITNHTSVTGAALDIELDGLGLLVAVLLAVQYGQLPVWYLILAVSRTLFVLGIWWRRRAGKPVYEMPPSENRRVVAGCQTGFIAVALWPIVDPHVAHLASIFFAIPLVVSFGRDWLVVSGVVHTDAQAYTHVLASTRRLIVEWLPFASRMLVALLTGAYLWYAAADGGISVSLPSLLLLAVVMMYVLGIAGRTASIVMLLAMLIYPTMPGTGWYSDMALVLLLAATTLVLHAGSGKFNLWHPDERLFHLQLGSSSD